MPARRVPQTIDERVADIDERLRRVERNAATTPVITQYSALQGTPTDLVTLSELNSQLAPIAAQAADAELLTWLRVAS